jgi:hypothetical protein
MGRKRPLLLCLVLTLSLAGTASSQNLPSGITVGPTSPNRQNQDLETQQELLRRDQERKLEELRRHDEQSRQQGRDPAADRAQVERFMEAIKRRRHRFGDFDKVVLHGSTPVTPEMLGLMAESPYAADIAYYLAKHPERSGAIAVMQPAEARQAVRQIEAVVVAENPARK